MYTEKLTRRNLLRAAGGVTFLALVSIGDGVFRPAEGLERPLSGPLPLFTALPYLQPGTGNGKLVEGQESIVIAWQTNKISADFTFEFGDTSKMGRSVMVVKTARWSGDSEDGEQRFNYVAPLDGLQLGKRYQYRVRMNGQLLVEGFFTTRKPRGAKTRFVSFGDNAFGETSEKSIAYLAYKALPDFIMNTGDNVYENGLDNEYARYFFPVYNADIAAAHVGAPLLRSVPFYTVIANHDMHGKDKDKNPVADFQSYPDSLAYFTNMHLPLNAPEPTYKTPVIGDKDLLNNFFACAGSRFPRMVNYSFDYGDLHFLCLDSNIHIDPTDTFLQTWIESDLAASDAPWKFVVYHHPAFNVGAEHYAEQHMRVLSPLFEKHGVSFVLNGHEHNYQRTRPLRFVPSDVSGAKNRNSKHRLVPGAFAVDRDYDGKANSKANGIIYITTGAGGKHLYDIDANEKPDAWRHEEDKNVEYIARFVSDRHSLTVFEVEGRSLMLRQIDEYGNEIDRCSLTLA